MKYKSKNIDFLTDDMKISNLCFYGEYYCFASDMEIPEAEEATDEEFAEAQASIVHVEPSIPEPTQLDLIQQAVEKSNDELRQEGAEAVTAELIERGIL